MTAPLLTVSQQGLGVVPADLLNTFGQTCDTFDQLRSFTGVSGVQVFARGQSAVGDGYQGDFYWSSTSVAVDDNENVIVPGGSVQGAWIRLGFSSLLDRSYSVQTPVTGFTIIFPNLTGSLFLRPAGTLATGTVNTPTTPVDGQTITISASQAITSFSLLPSSPQTVLNAPTTLAAGGVAKFQYVSSLATWFRA